MDRLLAQQEQVRGRRAQLDSELQQMDAEAKALADTKDALRAKRAEVEAWLAAHEAGGAGRTVDVLVYCKDTWSRQLMDAVVADAACDDAMIAMDRALSEGVVDCDKFVKQMRGLSRQQYFARQLALILQQRQKEAKGGAAQPKPLPSQPPLPLTGGRLSIPSSGAGRR